MKISELHESRIAALDVDGAVRFAEKHCMQAINNDTFLYRGRSNTNAEYMVADPSGSDRKSKTENNALLILTSILPSWTKYPNRRRSVITTNALNVARGFGNPYVVLPVDNSVLGVAPTSDFNLSATFTVSKKNRQLLSSAIVDAIQLYGDEFGRDFSPNDPTSVADWIDDVTASDILRSTDEDINDDMLYVGYMKSGETDFGKYINRLLSPDTNEFSISKVASIDKIEPNREIWTSGKCLVIDHSIFDDFIKRIKG